MWINKYFIIFFLNLFSIFLIKYEDDACCFQDSYHRFYPFFIANNGYESMLVGRSS